MLRQISHDGCESGVFTDSTYHNLQPLVPCFENNFNHHFSSFEFFPTHFIRQSYQAANKMWLSISVRLWVPQSFSFPGPLNVTAKRKRQNSSGKGPLSIINYLLIFSACRWPIYVGFLSAQAQDNLLFVERYSNVSTERLFIDNSLGVETLRNYPT